MIKPMLEKVSCNLCGSDETDVIYPSTREGNEFVDNNEFRSSGDETLREPLVKCRACGLQYVNPRLNSELVFDGYTNAIDEVFVAQAKSRERTFTRCLGEVDKIWKRAPGRVLDVGTANGSFLKVAKDVGWEVKGCEPNRWMCDWCFDNYGIRVDQGTIFDGNYQADSFDVVTLWDVLEHTPDPMATMRECCRVLRDGGLLVVNYPDIGSWIARLMGRRWVFLLSVHYFYFTKHTITQALTQVGLERTLIKPHFQTLELHYILTRARPYIGFPCTILIKIAKSMGFEQLQIPYWVGQTLVIGAKRTRT